MTLDDERNGLREGELLSRMLQLSGKRDTQYFYIRTERELDEIVDVFDESGYRYLHISCHANATAMATTFDTDITYRQLGEMLGPCLDGRRVFVSACEMANDRCAKALLSGTGCYSLIGPAKEILIDDAAAFWLSFYHLMFKVDARAMRHKHLRHYVGILSGLYGERINYFRHAADKDDGFERITTRRHALGPE
jgi:hypothetical protein